MFLSPISLLWCQGVSAYDGAINSLSDPGLQQVAATIATVEARHAAFLNELTMESPFPSALDQPLSPEEVIQAIGPLIVSCPFQVTGPTVRPGGSQFNASMMSPAPSHSGPLKLQSRGHYTDEQLQNDLVALNYALTLEHLEATYYQQGLAAFDMVAFAAAGYSSNVFDNYVLIGAHEAAHVEALGALISARGGTPVPPCEYNFNLSTVEEFVRTAQLLENTVSRRVTPGASRRHRDGDRDGGEHSSCVHLSLHSPFVAPSPSVSLSVAIGRFRIRRRREYHFRRWAAADCSHRCDSGGASCCLHQPAAGQLPFP